MNVGQVEVGESVYTFRPGEHRLSVEVDFGDAPVEAKAEWGGDALDFAQRIASARTFALERDLDELGRLGLAARAAPESVVVIGACGVFAAGRAFAADEPARHKLLDLIGDTYAHGGPPIGELSALRPGHAATHAALREALARGILAQRRE
jgi:UDP-3-O-[3-hydroxymyristoyl] N-acetylglucosamine deacetylase